LSKFCDSYNNTHDVVVSGNVAYVADDTDGLEIINVTNPSSMFEQGSFNDGGKARGIFISKNVICVADGSHGLEIIDPGRDNDDDGLSNVEELLIHSTDPNDEDSDDDGILDGEEVIEGADGYITDPNDNDSDDDGLLDGVEVLTYGTNPLSNDTDIDSLPDSWEIQYQSDPLVYNKEEDQDVDGLTNYEEYIHGTDPRLADTDGDGYTDGEEVKAGTNPLNPGSFPYDIIDFFKDYGLLLGIAVISIAVVSGGAIRWRSVKLKRLRLFISHAMEDFESYRITEIAKFLESKKEIAHVYYCEEHLVGHIDDWMKSTVPRCQLLIFFSTENSLESVDCLNEIRLARKNNIQIRPILGVNLRWEDLKKLNVNRDLGQEFTPTLFKEFCNELYEYTKQIKEDIEKAVRKKVKEKKFKN